MAFPLCHATTVFVIYLHGHHDSSPETTLPFDKFFNSILISHGARAAVNDAELSTYKH